HLPAVKTCVRRVHENIVVIYMGRITSWNDAAIIANNAVTPLPDMPVTAVHRSDGSGTTFHFTSFLSEVSRAWSDKVGRGTAVEWPAGIGGKGNEGVAGVDRKSTRLNSSH